MNSHPPSNRLLLSLPPRDLKELAPKLEFIRCEPEQILLDVDGLVESLAHPGGNLTGFSYLEPTVGAKWLELLMQIAPHLKHVALMFNPASGPYGSNVFSINRDRDIKVRRASGHGTRTRCQ
jgi:hypothetical protein